MRYSTTVFAALVALTTMSTARAGDFNFVAASQYEVAQRTSGISDEEQERRDREEERRDREQERRDRAEARREREAARRDRDRDRDEDRDDHDERRSLPHPRFWVGVGAGVGAASIAVPCSGSTDGSKDCTQSGDTGTYTANVTFSGPYTALRLRGIREQDKGDDRHTPYEEAALIGSRFGHSDWYGLVGVGRILHADDNHPDDTHGFAWEILFAPSSYSATGLELGFQGELGEDVDFIAFNLGLRFGQLR